MTLRLASCFGKLCAAVQVLVQCSLRAAVREDNGTELIFACMHVPFPVLLCLLTSLFCPLSCLLSPLSRSLSPRSLAFCDESFLDVGLHAGPL